MSEHREFTARQKASIFKRDRATCCFTGANLWLLDAPVRVGWQSDWVDHIRPKSRGGNAALDNGACTSHTYNMKKRNNSADTTFLFKAGHPTPLFFELFGAPCPSVKSRLARLANLEETDWYFNRAVTWVYEALNGEWAKPGYIRTPEKWFLAAWNKLAVFQKLGKDVPSLEEREIITNPSPTHQILLSIRVCGSANSLKKAVRPLSAQYRRNSQICWNYFYPCHDDLNVAQKTIETKRQRAYEKACRIQNQLTHDTFECIQADHKIRFGSVQF